MKPGTLSLASTMASLMDVLNTHSVLPDVFKNINIHVSCKNFLYLWQQTPTVKCSVLSKLLYQLYELFQASPVNKCSNSVYSTVPAL